MRTPAAGACGCRASVIASTTCPDVWRPGQRGSKKMTCRSLSLLAGFAVVGALSAPAGAPQGGRGGGRGGAAAPPPLMLKAYCRVAMVLAPSADSHIEMELWL